MIDTHCHIYLPEFDADRAEVIDRAKKAGINKIYMPNIDSASINLMLAVNKKYEDICLPMIGLHPCNVKENYENELKIIENNLENTALKFYGIGETGLDYYWDSTFALQQKAVFEFQIQLAKQYNLPIIIHSRNSLNDCIALIKKNKYENLRGIFHCFSGTAEQLEKIIEINFYAGIGGVATFKNGGLDNVLSKFHLPHVVLETDSPYLAPVPFRGKRNEPAYISYTLKKLSEIMSASENEIEEITTINANKIFKQS